MMDSAKHPGGRPSVKTPEIVEEICTRLMNGETLREICRDPHLPHRATVFRWLHADKEFCDQYTIAREIQLDDLADEMLEIADDSTNDWIERHREGAEEAGWRVHSEHIQRSRLRIETRKWLLGKLAPKKYGDRVEIDSTHRGHEGGLVQVEQRIYRYIVVQPNHGVDLEAEEPKH
jgi:hypothetical protein